MRIFGQEKENMQENTQKIGSKTVTGVSENFSLFILSAKALFP